MYHFKIILSYLEYLHCGNYIHMVGRTYAERQNKDSRSRKLWPGGRNLSDTPQTPIEPKVGPHFLSFPCCRSLAGNKDVGVFVYLIFLLLLRMLLREEFVLKKVRAEFSLYHREHLYLCQLQANASRLLLCLIVGSCNLSLAELLIYIFFLVIFFPSW